MSQGHETVKVGEDFLQFVIKLESMCRILSDNQVREDFKCGKIVNVNNPEIILSSIDIISEIVFPNWKTLMFHDSRHIENSKIHLRLLSSKSDLIFDIKSDDEDLELFSYNAWNEAFSGLFLSPYWQNSLNNEYVYQPVSKQHEDLSMHDDNVSVQDDISVSDTMITLCDGIYEDKQLLHPLLENNSTGRLQSRFNRRKKHVQPEDYGDDIICSQKLIPKATLTGPPKSHQCPDCDYSADKEYRLRLHIDNVHLGLRPYQCPHCDYAAGQSCTLRAHVRVIHEGIKPFSCPECPRRFGHRKNLTLHINTIHKKLKNYKCDLCDFAAVSAATRTLHKAQVHNVGNVYKCKHCDYTNNSLSVLQDHISSVHKKEKNFKCTICKYAGASKKLLWTHMKKHTKVQEKKCRQCSYTTYSQKFLYQHVEKMHQVDICHQCEECSYMAPNSTKLKRHVASMHEKLDDMSEDNATDSS